MKLELANLNKEGYKGAVVSDNVLTLQCIRPTIIQPSEILKIQTEIVLQVPQGYILNISTHPDLYEKAGELFPALVVLDSLHLGEVVLLIRNSGRNPLNLMPGDFIAQGHVTQMEEIDCQELEWHGPARKSLPQTGPQKRDPFHFEVK